MYHSVYSKQFSSCKDSQTVHSCKYTRRLLQTDFALLLCVCPHTLHIKILNTHLECKSISRQKKLSTITHAAEHPYACIFWKVKHKTLLVHEKLILLRIYNTAGLGYFPLLSPTVSHRIWSCLPLIECLTSETAATPWEAYGVSGE